MYPYRVGIGTLRSAYVIIGDSLDISWVFFIFLFLGVGALKSAYATMAIKGLSDTMSETRIERKTQGHLR